MEDIQDLANIFSASQKELLRGPRQLRMEDLSSKQIAVAASNMSKFIAASDLMAIGGEAVTCLNRLHRFRLAFCLPMSLGPSACTVATKYSAREYKWQ